MPSKELLRKYIIGDCTQQEKEDIQRWVEADEKNKKELMDLRMLYNITVGYLPEPDSHNVSQRTDNRKFRILDWAKIAAAIVITFCCTYYFLKIEKDVTEVAMQTIHVPAGQRAEVTLTDGTRVWLNALTTFTFPNKFTENAREVYLDGEGYFDVAHDDKKLFSVNTDKYKVNVLGTEFNVTAYAKAQQFETSLINGSVEIVSLANNQHVILSPGNRAFRQTGELITDKIQHTDYFLWTKGIISFDNERIDDILYKLQFYYDIEIVNSNNKINNIRYTGKFYTKDGVEHVLDVLKIATGLRFKKDNELKKIQIN